MDDHHFSTSSYGWSPRLQSSRPAYSSILHGVCAGGGCSRTDISNYFSGRLKWHWQTSPCHNSCIKVTVWHSKICQGNWKQGKHVSTDTVCHFKGWMNFCGNETWVLFIHSFILDETPWGNLGVWGGVASGVGTQGPHIINTHSLGTYLSLLLISGGLIYFIFFWSLKNKLMGFFDSSMTRIVMKLWAIKKLKTVLY
jgi:hypothetical protein